MSAWPLLHRPPLRKKGVFSDGGPLACHRSRKADKAGDPYGSPGWHSQNLNTLSLDITPDTEKSSSTHRKTTILIAMIAAHFMASSQEEWRKAVTWNKEITGSVRRRGAPPRPLGLQHWPPAPRSPTKVLGSSLRSPGCGLPNT